MDIGIRKEDEKNGDKTQDLSRLEEKKSWKYYIDEGDC